MQIRRFVIYARVDNGIPDAGFDDCFVVMSTNEIVRYGSEADGAVWPCTKIYLMMYPRPKYPSTGPLFLEEIGNRRPTVGTIDGAGDRIWFQ